MAQYKYGVFLKLNQSADFDTIHKAGETTPYSGIYRCEGCGQEVISVHDHPLPPQNHHQHTQAQGHIRWQLIVSH